MSVCIYVCNMCVGLVVRVVSHGVDELVSSPQSDRRDLLDVLVTQLQWSLSCTCMYVCKYVMCLGEYINVCNVCMHVCKNVYIL